MKETINEEYKCDAENYPLLDLRDEFIDDEVKAKGVIYKTLWFAAKGIDVEYSKAAVDSYNKYTVFAENNKSIIKNETEENRLDVCNGERIYADLMNGWWYPFKVLFGLQGKKEKICENLIKKLDEKAELNDTIAFETLYEGKKYNEALRKALVKFLNVVYTIGNMTPTVQITRANMLDNWNYKLLNQMYSGATYFGVVTTDDLFKIVCEKYYYQDYITNAEEEPLEALKNYIKVKDFRNNPKEYFEYYTERVLRRGCRICFCTNKISEEEWQQKYDNCKSCLEKK